MIRHLRKNKILLQLRVRKKFTKKRFTTRIVLKGDDMINMKERIDRKYPKLVDNYVIEKMRIIQK